MSKAFKLFSATVHNIDFLFWGLYNLIQKLPGAHNIMFFIFIPFGYCRASEAKTKSRHVLESVKGSNPTLC